MPFIYRPLNNATKEIRLLDVRRPASSEEPINCSLQHASLASPFNEWPHYETISYFWGDPERCSKIVVDGQALAVPANTETALRCMASDSGDETRTLWIDAVCINQDDVTERQHQVAMMKDVFSLCQRTLVYLGQGVYSERSENDGGVRESEDVTQRAIDHIGHLHEEVMSDVINAGWETLADLLKPLGSAGLVRIDDPPTTSLDVQTLSLFYSLPYFSRVWIVQEVALPPSTRCFCRDVQVELRMLLDVATWLRQYRYLHIPGVLARALDGANTMWALGRFYAIHDSVAISDLMVQCRDRHVLDARDKIFGSLGMHISSIDHSAVRKLLTPDYNKHISEIMRDSTRYSIVDSDETTSPLFLLNFVSHRGDSDLRAEGFASWVPRLDRDGNPKEDSSPLIFHGRSLSQSPLDQDLVMSTYESDSLRLRGRYLSHIVQVSAVLKIAILDTDAFGEWLKSVQQLSSVTAGGDARLARILVTDTSHMGIRTEADVAIGLEAIKRVIIDHGGVKYLKELRNDDDDLTKHASHYMGALAVASRNRRHCLIANHLQGLVPRTAEVNDIVVLLNGAEFPSVLRPHDGHFLFIGVCYIDGAMQWQEEYESMIEGLEERVFELH